MNKRIFIAINIPTEITCKIIELENKLIKFDWPIKWTEPDNLHITLRFLGSINEEQLSEVSTMVESIVNRCCSFELVIRNYIILPDLSAPRIIALEVDDNEMLLNLQGELAKAIEERGIGESERFPFTGHITIGRMEPVKTNFRGLKQIEFQEHFEVKSVEIMSSELLSTGPKYKAIKSYELQR